MSGISTSNSFHIQKLHVEDIPSMLALQTIVYDRLPDDKKRFILPKSASYLKKHFANGSQAYGIIKEGQHVGQFLVALPSMLYPDTAMVDFDMPHAPNDIAVLQGLLVHPDYRGLSYGILMINVFIDIVGNLGKLHAYAETEVRNHHSWELFLDAGMAIISHGYDADEDAKLFHHYKQLTPKPPCNA